MNNILNATYEKDNFGADYSLVSGASALTIWCAEESLIISNEGEEHNKFHSELFYSEISSIFILKDRKKSYRPRFNFLITVASILVCILIEGSLTSNLDPNFAFDIFLGIIIGILLSSMMPITHNLLTICFGEDGKSKMLVSFKGTKDEIFLIDKMINEARA